MKYICCRCKEEGEEGLHKSNGEFEHYSCYSKPLEQMAKILNNVGEHHGSKEKAKRPGGFDGNKRRF